MLSRPRPNLGALVRRPPEAPPLRSETALPGMRIGLLGGSFDPPHEGHLHVARTAMRRLGLDRVWLLVSPQNPLKTAHAASDYARRLAATRALATEPGLVVSDLEARLGARYTIDTVRALRRMRPRVRFVYLMGADNLAQIHRWKAWREIFATVPVAVVARPGDLSRENPGDAIRARLGPAARLFRDARLDAAGALALPEAKPPAWVYLTAPLNPASSTALRAREGR